MQYTAEFLKKVYRDLLSVRLFEEKQVAVVPGIAFEAEGFCRLSYAISVEKIREGLERIADFVSNLK